MEALDIELIPGDEEEIEHLKFTWDLVEYESEDLKIQLYFDFPDEISEEGSYDQVSVTFWGTEFFQSKDGEPVRYGSQISTTVLRQIDSEKANELEGIFGTGLLILGLILLLFVFLLLLTGGSLLPIWIFITSLTLLVHTVLFGADMPNDVFYVLKVALKFLRLDLMPLDSDEDVRPGEKFVLVGYQSTSFLTNMSYLLLGPLALTIALWVLALLKDMVTPRRSQETTQSCCRRSWCQPMMNIFLRVLILLLLEVSICAVLDIKARFVDFKDEPMESVKT